MRNKVIGKILILALALVTIMGCISVVNAAFTADRLPGGSRIDEVTIDDGGGSSGGSTGSTEKECDHSGNTNGFVTSGGKHVKTCSVCGKQISSHSANWGSWTLNSSGMHRRTCKTCSISQSHAPSASNVYEFKKGSLGGAKDQHRAQCSECTLYLDWEDCTPTLDEGNDYHKCGVCGNQMSTHHIFSGSDCIYCDAWIWINDFDMQGQLLYDFDYTMVGYSGGCTFPTFSSFVVKTDYTPYTSETTIAPLVVKAAAVTHGNFDFHYGSELQKYNEWATRWGEDESDFDFPVENIEREMSDWIGGHEDIEEIITGRIR